MVNIKKNNLGDFLNLKAQYNFECVRILNTYFKLIQIPILIIK